LLHFIFGSSHIFAIVTFEDFLNFCSSPGHWMLNDVWEDD
jgi:hypothetical protein